HDPHGASNDPLISFLSVVVGAAVFFALNVYITAALIAARTGQSFRVVLVGDAKGFATNFFALSPLAWLMSQLYFLAQGAGWLATELPIIRHHHEWYNGSGYPDRLMGDEIPRLARILHVADAFEAMTAARPYRMKPLTAEQALGELRKYAGIQFDPTVVEAFVRTKWVEG